MGRYIKNPFYPIEEWYVRVRNKFNCPHSEWDQDKQIRVIECKGCGKRARVVEYRNLF